VFAGIEAANAVLVERWFGLLGKGRRGALVGVRPTLDLDPTDVEVFGSEKEGVAYSYEGKRVGRPHLVVWAEAGVVVAADYGDGRSDPRGQAPGLIRRAVAGLPKELQAPIVRADSGFFDVKVASAAIEAGCDFAIVAKRSTATWASVGRVSEGRWRPAVGMAGAEVAECDYRPVGWPPGTRCVVRRVRVDADDISGDERSRRRRTMDPAQLRLALNGEVGHVYAYSFILTNLSWLPVPFEAWFRQRALVEERIKDAKLGAALRHLPSGKKAVNRTWMWAALLALNISNWIQSLAGADMDGRGRAHGKRLRRELICVPARIVHRARYIVIRLAAGVREGPFERVWCSLRLLPTRPPPGAVSG
jgi:hypothetical protein